jgi:predicted RNase H-like HicB family nuclease
MGKKVLIEVEESNDGVTVTSPLFPEFLTCGQNLKEAMENLPDAIIATLELYRQEKKPLPSLQ